MSDMNDEEGKERFVGPHVGGLLQVRGYPLGKHGMIKLQIVVFNMIIQIMLKTTTLPKDTLNVIISFFGRDDIDYWYPLVKVIMIHNQMVEMSEKLGPDIARIVVEKMGYHRKPKSIRVTFTKNSIPKDHAFVELLKGMFTKDGLISFYETMRKTYGRGYSYHVDGYKSTGFYYIDFFLSFLDNYIDRTQQGQETFAKMSTIYDEIVKIIFKMNGQPERMIQHELTNSALHITEGYPHGYSIHMQYSEFQMLFQFNDGGEGAFYLDITVFGQIFGV